MTSERRTDGGGGGGRTGGGGGHEGADGGRDGATGGRNGADGGRTCGDRADGGEGEATDPEHHGTASGPSRRDLLSTVATVGSTYGLAGCTGFETETGGESGPRDGTGTVPPEASTSVAAAPAVLGPVPQRVLGLPELRVEELTEGVTPSDGGETVAATSYLVVHERPRETDQPVPMRFGVTDLAARSFAMLSTPSPERVGAVVDPLATEPPVEVLAGDRGKRLLQQAGVVETADFDWVRQPRQLDAREVEVLGTATEGATFLGVAAVGDGTRTTVLTNFARVPHGGDVVVAAEFVRRQTPPEPFDRGGACVDDGCQLVGPAEAALWREYRRAVKATRICTETSIQGNVVEVCPQPDDDGTTFVPPDEKVPTFGVGNVRVVQHVEDTVVRAPNQRGGYEEDDPPLVRGENTAVVFEVDTIDHLDWMDQPLTVEIYTEDDSSEFAFDLEGSFELTQEDLRSIVEGEPTLSVLHRISNDDDDNEVPVFELESDQVRISPKAAANPIDWDTTGVAHGFAVHEPTEVDPLKVGFVAIRDAPPGGKSPGDRYGNSAGLPVDFFRTAASATEYLQRVFPGDVVTYVHEDMAVPGKGGFLCTGDCAVDRDMKRAKRELERVVTDPSYHPNGPGFPGGGTLRTDGLDRDRMASEISSNGFDVTVAIVPDVAPGNGGAAGYFDYWGSPNTAGESPTSSSAAVAMEGTSKSGGDQVPSFVAAHELGHYFQEGYDGPSGHPMAQRDDDASDATANGEPVDFAHARHQNSDNDGDGDPDLPGVVSTAYDLVGGFDVVRAYRNPNGSFGVVGPDPDSASIPKLESYMSYTDKLDEAWADARIHRQLVDSGWTFSGMSGSGSLRAMLSGDGSVDDDGSIRFDEVVAFEGVDEYTDSEDNPVLVELLDPEGDTLVEARVPYEADLVEEEGVGGETGGSVDATADGPVPAPSFRLPFREAGVRVRASYEGRTTEFNPVERSVRDAVGRVPPAGLTAEPATVEDEVGDALDAVAALMAEGAYGDAAAVVDDQVRAAIEEHVVAYEAALTEPTLGMLTDLVDEVVGRLAAIGGSVETGLVLELPDGSTQCIEPVESSGSAAEYYGFDDEGNNSSNTPDGLERDDATVTFVHRNANTGERSLVVLHGDPDATTGDGGAAVMTFGGLEGVTWQVQDGPPGNDAYTTADGEVGSPESAAWSWPDDRSDGGVLGPLGDAPSVGVVHHAESTVNGETYQRGGVEQWLFVDGADVGNPVEVANFVDEADGDVGVRLYAGEC